MKPIKLKNVTKSFDGKNIIKDINITVKHDQFHCIAGPNGSGKTTLSRLFLGLYHPTKGNISRPEKARYGCSYQRPNFYKNLTVAENLSIFSKTENEKDKKWIETVKEKLDLKKILDKKCSELSAGNANRLDLSLAVLKKPDFLILDEPLSNLDEYSRSIFLEFIQEQPINGAIFLSHHPEPFENLIERLTVIEDGKILEDKHLEEIESDGFKTFSDYYEDVLGTIH